MQNHPHPRSARLALSQYLMTINPPTIEDVVKGVIEATSIPIDVYLTHQQQNTYVISVTNYLDEDVIEKTHKAMVDLFGRNVSGPHSEGGLSYRLNIVPNSLTSPYEWINLHFDHTSDLLKFCVQNGVYPYRIDQHGILFLQVDGVNKSLQTCRIKSSSLSNHEWKLGDVITGPYGSTPPGDE